MIKFYPIEIKKTEERIVGLKADFETIKSHPITTIVESKNEEDSMGAFLIHYNKKLMDTPEVAIKEFFPNSSKIIKFAQENNIPIVDDYTLGWNLYCNCEEGDPVPYESYEPVSNLFCTYYKISKEATKE